MTRSILRRPAVSILAAPMLAAPILAALALSACSPAEQAGQNASTPADAPSDPGRGVMLNARLDRAQTTVGQAVTAGTLSQSVSDRLTGELASIRGELSGALSDTTGPIPAATRQSLSARLDAVEAELAATP